MKCPRCGGDMSSGVCEDCGFPETLRIPVKYRKPVHRKKPMVRRLSR